ncbi:hypothetical protein Tco_0811779 [Tanacetum coccineum]
MAISESRDVVDKLANEVLLDQRADVLCLRADVLKRRANALDQRSVDLDRLADALDPCADGLEWRLDVLGRRVDSNITIPDNSLRSASFFLARILLLVAFFLLSRSSCCDFLLVSCYVSCYLSLAILLHSFTLLLANFLLSNSPYYCVLVVTGCDQNLMLAFNFCCLITKMQSSLSCSPHIGYEPRGSDTTCRIQLAQLADVGKHFLYEKDVKKIMQKSATELLSLYNKVWGYI